jgi:hypothetical protein
LGETVKCRVGERIVYQETPCPPRGQIQPLAAPLPEPDVFEVDAARRRAVADQVQLKSLEQERAAREKAEREAAEAAAQQQRKAAKKHAKKCKALRAEAKKKGGEKEKEKAREKLQEHCSE